MKAGSDMTNDVKKPQAVAGGMLFEELGICVPCYVLDDGRRVISRQDVPPQLSRTVVDPQDAERGRQLSTLLSQYDEWDQLPAIEFVLPHGSGSVTGHEASCLFAIFTIYAGEATYEDATDEDQTMGRMATMMCSSLETWGINALIDEAAGYKRPRRAASNHADSVMKPVKA